MATLTFDIGRRSGWNMTVRDTIQLSTTTCDECGIVYAIPTKMMEQARELGQSKITWYCPNGHRGIGFHGKSEAEQVQEVLEEERRRRRMAQERADRERDRADENERRRAAQKGATTKLAKRAKAGTCPCCNRTFRQLARHMKSQHPSFRPELDVVAGEAPEQDSVSGVA